MNKNLNKLNFGGAVPVSLRGGIVAQLQKGRCYISEFRKHSLKIL